MTNSLGRWTVTLSAALGLLAGCDSVQGSDLEGAPSSRAIPTTARAECFEPVMLGSENLDEQRLTPKMDAVQLPPGTCFSAVDVIPTDGELDRLTVYVDLRIQGSSTPDDLRPAGVEIAHFLKNEEIGERMTSLRITNWGASSRSYESYLADDNFRNNKWDGSLSHDAEMAIWSVREQGR